jgi:HKD family nuclease
MEIINNRNSSNHLKKLLDCFSVADEIIIVSPFISEDFNFFPFEKIKHLKRIRLITHLKPFTADQYKKVKFLKRLFEFGNKHHIDIEVYIDNTLHGKIYIGTKENIHIEGVITSANFTRNGLNFNNEWGACLTSQTELATLANNLFDHIILEQITEAHIAQFEEILLVNPLMKPNCEITIDLAHYLSLKNNPLNIVRGASFWLKPIGVTGDIIPWGESHAALKANLHFSVKPKGVEPGHIIITYAVGHSHLLSVYRVVSETKRTTNSGDRWKYFVIGENLTPFFGDQWHKQGLTITNQKAEAIQNNIGDITPSGKNSFGSLMRGADKLRITTTFANFVINKMITINEAIASNSE